MWFEMVKSQGFFAFVFVAFCYCIYPCLLLITNFQNHECEAIFLSTFFHSISSDILCCVRLTSSFPPSFSLAAALTNLTISHPKLVKPILNQQLDLPTTAVDLMDNFAEQSQAKQVRFKSKFFLLFLLSCSDEFDSWTKLTLINFSDD
jgi:hypothetical protein